MRVSNRKRNRDEGNLRGRGIEMRLRGIGIEMRVFKRKRNRDEGI